MCLIVNNPQGKILHPVRIASAHKNNPHGVGVMWYDAAEDRVHSSRGMLNFADFWKLHESLEGIPHAIHFRWRTRGEIGAEFCHPFKVLDKETHGVDLYMMHNGTLSGIETTGGKSDSGVFAERLRDKIATWKNPLDVLHPHILRRMGKTIGGGNKLLFMGSGGTTVIVNADSGWFDDDDIGACEIDTFDGVGTPTWYSNQYSFSGLSSASWYTEPVGERTPTVRTWTRGTTGLWNDEDDESLVGDLVKSASEDDDSEQSAAYAAWLKDRRPGVDDCEEAGEEAVLADTIPPTAGDDGDATDSYWAVTDAGAVVLRQKDTGKILREMFPAPKTKEEEVADKRRARKDARKKAKAARRMAASEKWTDVAKREGYIRRRDRTGKVTSFQTDLASAEKSMLAAAGVKIHRHHDDEV